MRARRLLLVLLAPGCGYGLHQTAKTQLPGTTSLQTGVSQVTNQVLSAQDAAPLHLGAEVGPLRFGLSDHVDMGVGLLYGIGARVDSKFDLLPHANPLAIAPRIGTGVGSRSGQAVVMWMGGAIVSYD